MAKELAIYIQIMNLLKANGLEVTVEEAKALRIEHKLMRKDDIRQFCAAYAAKHQWIKTDVLIRDVSCRIWVKRGTFSGIIKKNDESSTKLLSFIWGRKPNGQWYTHPAVYQNGVRLQFRDGLKTYSASELRNKQVVEAVEAAIKRVYSDYHKAA